MISYRELFESILNSDFDSSEELSENELKAIQKVREQLTELYASNDLSLLEASFSELEDPEMKFANTLLAQIVVDAILSKKDIHLLITSIGNCYVSDSECGNELIASSELNNEPYIKYPIHLLLSQFIQRAEMVSTDELTKFNFLSDKEVKLLELLRKENLVSLSVSFGQDREIKLIETEESIKVDNPQGKLTDYLLRNNYQEIVCKTQNGKITSIRRKTKHK